MLNDGFSNRQIAAAMKISAFTLPQQLYNCIIFSVNNHFNALNYIFSLSLITAAARLSTPSLEPCDYYTFGNKIEAEINDYNRLKKIGIKMPAMLDADIKNERILKEYVDGETKTI